MNDPVKRGGQGALVYMFCTGGTIDKTYRDALSDYQVGEPQVAQTLDRAGLVGQCRLQSWLRKDSLEITADDRTAVRSAVVASDSAHILIDHGTDTMLETAHAPDDAGDKTIVLVGAMQPARMRESGADFNIGFAWGALRC